MEPIKEIRTMEAPTFAEFTEFLRNFACISSKKQITAMTRFENDLGITGDDGDDLLIATEKRFEVKLSRETFNLRPNEYLFNSEGLDFLGLFKGLLGAKETVREFTVGELYDAVCRGVNPDEPTLK